MTRRSRNLIAWGLGVLVILALVLAAWALMPTRTRAIAPAALPAPGTAELQRLVDAGGYVATASDCIACHTAPGGSPFAGGLPLASPIGRIYSTNISPDPEVGIGRYTLDDFDRAVRHGIARDGRTLYPAMPYPSYARLSDEDTKALYAFFMHGVTAVPDPNRDTDIAWPLSMRWPLAIWRKTFAASREHPPRFDAQDYGGDITVARGAYLVQSAGHCGACHTPRAVTLQEQALDEGSPLFLAGGALIDGWLASNLRGDSASGLGRWRVDDIVATLKTGRNRNHAVVGGAMQDVVVHSTQHLRDADLTAIATYLKTLPGSSKAEGQQLAYAHDERTARELEAGKEASVGARLYVDNCAACHRTNGLGHADAFPTIAGNPTVLAREPDTLIRLILAGAKLPGTAERPSPLGMPGFDWRLNDREVAELASFVRNAWGNRAPEVRTDAVTKLRRAIKDEDNAAGNNSRRLAGAPEQR